MKTVHLNATLPEFKTQGSIGFDLHSPTDVTLTSNATTIIHMGLYCVIFEALYMRLGCRSSLVVTHLSVKGGVIDNNYRE